MQVNSKNSVSHAQIIYKHTVFMFKRPGGLQCDSDKVRTAGKQTILCYNETNPTQVSVRHLFISSVYI